MCSFCLQKLQKRVVGPSIHSCKSQSFFKFLSILEENCAADIIIATIECNLFVDKWFKKMSLVQAYFPTKVVFFLFVLPTSLVKQLIVVFLLSNGSKRFSWVKHTLL